MKRENRLMAAGNVSLSLADTFPDGCQVIKCTSASGQWVPVVVAGEDFFVSLSKSVCHNFDLTNPEALCHIFM